MQKKTDMNYQKGTGNFIGWLIEEASFSPEFLGKCEAIFTQGNGYLGQRHALEEPYVGETRNLFVAGTFNKFDENEVTELPNLPDVTNLTLYIGGRRFTMEAGTVKDYSRTMNLKTGEVVRSLIWKNGEDEVKLSFSRIVSMKNRHVIAFKTDITPLSGDLVLSMISGINGQATNSGTQHLSEGTKRVYEGGILEYRAKTIQSGVEMILHSAFSLFEDGKAFGTAAKIVPSRRKLSIRYDLTAEKGKTVTLEKICMVHTTRDLAYANMPQGEAAERLPQDSLHAFKTIKNTSYSALLSESAKVWAGIWADQDILVESSQPDDQLAIRFALYHLNILVKKDDNRVGAAAKGLTGEGYKGHSFWDTETYMFPYFLYSQPEVARTLLEYRYKSLVGARKKAKENGYEGAMYPWESAWIDDGEVTPVWVGVDLITGEPLKCLTGMIEQHITADIAFAVYQYDQVTGDEDFMERCGYEILLDTARFWCSRLEWNEKDSRYEIRDVIGPDEYKEHVDNNAYTNYLVYLNMRLAAEDIKKLRAEKPALYGKLDKRLNLGMLEKNLEKKLPLLFLPQPDGETGIIPQFDGYLQLSDLDLTKYKSGTAGENIFKKYNLETLRPYRVAKQADVVSLLYLLEDLFSPEIKRKNYLYHEARTLHESSLSKAVHSVLASDLGMYKEAYDMFLGAGMTDLGPRMNSSNEGIHAANMGGIWQDAVMGFGGIRLYHGQMRIQPNLPSCWTRLTYSIWWRGSRLTVTVTKDSLTIDNQGGEVEILHNGETVLLPGGKKTVLSNKKELP